MTKLYIIDPSMFSNEEPYKLGDRFASAVAACPAVRWNRGWVEFDAEGAEALAAWFKRDSSGDEPWRFTAQVLMGMTSFTKELP